MLTDTETENRRLALKLAVNENIPEPITTTTARAEKFLEFLEPQQSLADARLLRGVSESLDAFVELIRQDHELALSLGGLGRIMAIADDMKARMQVNR